MILIKELFIDVLFLFPRDLFPTVIIFGLYCPKLLFLPPETVIRVLISLWNDLFVTLIICIYGHNFQFNILGYPYYIYCVFRQETSRMYMNIPCGLCTSVTGRRTVLNSGSAARSLKINTWETNNGGTGRLIYSEKAGNLGWWWTNKPKTIFRRSQRVLKGKVRERGDGLCAGEVGVQIVSQMSIWSWTDLLVPGAAVSKCHQALSYVIVSSFTPQSQWCANLKESRLIRLQTKGFRLANKECIRLKGVNSWDWLECYYLRRMFLFIKDLQGVTHTLKRLFQFSILEIFLKAVYKKDRMI